MHFGLVVCIDSDCPREARLIELFDEYRAGNVRKAQPLAARMRPRTPRRVRRPGALPRPRQAAAPAAAGRPARLGDLLRPARHAARRRWPTSSPTTRAAASARSTPSPPASRRSAKLLDEARRELEDDGPAHDPVRRRAAPLQPRPAGRAAARRRGRPRHPDRRDDAEPVLRHQLAAAEPQPDLHVRAADARADQDAAAAGPGRQGARPRRRCTVAMRRGRARVPGRDERRRRPAGADRPWRSACCPPANAADVEFTLDVAQDSIQRKVLDYDPTGDAHYDVASAFIKSMRGSDPGRGDLLAGADAGSRRGPALHRPAAWSSARPRTSATPTRRRWSWPPRRLQAVEFVGLPECQLALAQAVTYIATAPKSNAATLAIGKAREDVRTAARCAVPAASARRALPRRGAARPRRRLQVQPRLRRRPRRAGVSARGAPLLRTGRPRLRGGDQEEDGRKEARPPNRRTCVGCRLYSPFIGRGGIRTHTPVTREGILSPQCLPFHHAAPVAHSRRLMSAHPLANPIVSNELDKPTAAAVRWCPVSLPITP